MQYLIWDFDGTLGYREGGWSGTCRGRRTGASPATLSDVLTLPTGVRAVNRSVPASGVNAAGAVVGTFGGNYSNTAFAQSPTSPAEQAGGVRFAESRCGERP